MGYRILKPHFPLGRVCMTAGVAALDFDPEEIGRPVRRHHCNGLADVERIQRTKVASESPSEMTARINPQNPIRKENRTASSRWWL